uniref:Retrotransposon protein, putative, Ty1-copia subclass n=1 Tax=Tanacetum cinerariifolium TaxID=118510 RepID=A0A6L2KYT4_TANCI|nr:retrotransposon protein, putative, Ty1-copia subclass [Tanacetum cinerariifolium]
MEKFFQIFQDLHFDISFADALLLMPKFASTIKSLLTNKDKLFELAKIPLNENCSAMLLKKLPKKLGDLGKFVIRCDFPRMDISKDLCPKTNEELDRISRVPYASAVGSIIYAMTCTRPDVSFALSMVSRNQQNPGEGYWTAIKNILKYLRNTKDMFLVYCGEEELRVTGYCDASWQTNKDDSRSQSGWIFLLNRGAVT